MHTPIRTVSKLSYCMCDESLPYEPVNMCTFNLPTLAAGRWQLFHPVLELTLHCRCQRM